MSTSVLIVTEENKLHFFEREYQHNSESMRGIEGERMIDFEKILVKNEEIGEEGVFTRVPYKESAIIH